MRECQFLTGQVVAEILHTQHLGGNANELALVFLQNQCEESYAAIHCEIARGETTPHPLPKGILAWKFESCASWSVEELIGFLVADKLLLGRIPFERPI